MPIYDPEKAKSEILAAFKNIPNIYFGEGDAQKIELSFPAIYRDRDLRQAAKSRIEKKRDIRTTKSNDGTNLGRLNYCLSQALSKFEFGKTEEEVWERHMRFYAESLQSDRHGGYSFVEREIDERSHEAAYINLTRTGARDWFQNDLVAKIIAAPHKDQLILGAPGSGKSTLLKYLLNSNSVFLRNKRTVFSRFEFLKFTRVWAHRSPELAKAILPQYLSYIVLRDLLVYHCYDRVSTNSLIRRTTGRFGTIEIQRTIAQILESQSDRTKSEISHFDRILDCLEPLGVDGGALKRVDHRNRLLLIKELKEDLRLAIIFDGLDAISMEDDSFETDRMIILTHVLKNGRAGLTNQTIVGDLKETTDFSCVFIMRPNTHYLYRDNNVTDIPDFSEAKHYVGALNENGVLYGALRRAAEEWVELAQNSVRHNVLLEGDLGLSEKVENLEATTNRLYRSFLVILMVLNGSIGTLEKKHLIQGTFNGNIRDLNEFIFRVVNWFIIEADRAELLNFAARDDVSKIFDVITSKEGRALLRSKSYQIVEVLLHDEIPWFENAIVDPKRGQNGKAFSELQKLRKEKLSNNEDFTGFIDNIFNYHLSTHGYGSKYHSLLQKIRILQFLNKKEMTKEELLATLNRSFTYVSEAVDESINILLRVQLLEIRDDETLLKIKTTKRGNTALNYLSRNMSYLEHVFHQVMLPTQLIETVSDQIRDPSTDVWTAQSIRNMFIFLTYLQFVEREPVRQPSGAVAYTDPIPEADRIFESIRRNVHRSVRRILKSDRSRIAERQWPGRHQIESFESYVANLIANVQANWRIGLPSKNWPMF